MASSSDAQRALGALINPYHVFLSHRGPDTKDNLASFIYHYLADSGVNVFFDINEFVPGQNIPHAIPELISLCSVQVAILSPRYAESHWCLEELRLMHNTGAKIIPVFCEVCPQDVVQLQKKEGIYAEAFKELAKKKDCDKIRYEPDTIEEWRLALCKVGDIPESLVSNSEEFNGDLGKLAVALCDKVKQQLQRCDGLVRLEMPSSTRVQKTLEIPIRPYDVFISYHCPDTKNHLASFMYHSFSERGVNMFINRDEFVAGKEMPPAVSEAISTSSVHIAVLSPNYAESHWCLEELYLMQNTGARIIPVFYKVPPGDLQRLRKGEGMYAEVFKKLSEGENSGELIRGEKNGDTIEKWRNALCKMSNISGFLDSEEFKGDSGILAVKVRIEVMHHLRRVWIKTGVYGLFGLDKTVNDFKNFLEISKEQSEKVNIVGIVGTAGCGKTKLAEEFYYSHRSSFDRSSLLAGVRESSKQNGLPTLQSQLLKELTNDCLAISNITEGKEIIADRLRRLCGTKSWNFLIVIDDVDHHQQLQALLREADILSSGSLVIVTARNKAVLKLSGISLVYETKPMYLKDAEELLRSTAFRQSQLTNGLNDLIQSVLSKCGHSPEFLGRLGRNLHLYGNNDKQQWEDELQMLMPEIFKAICGDLEEEERQIFLDIACFFEKMEKNSAIRVWAGSGWRGARALKKLEYMCLVHVDDASNFFIIPDYLRDLGRAIADRQLHSAPDLPCRLWRSNTARDFLKEPLLQTSAKIRGTREASHKKLFERATDELLKIDLLHVRGDIRNGTFWEWLKHHTLSLIPTLKVLNSQSGPSFPKLNSAFRDRLRNLVWLRWEECPEAAISLAEMNNLRVLELLKGEFEKLDQLPVELREMTVECTRLVQIPPTIGMLSQLEKLTLDCTVSLECLPTEFCDLQALKHLVLRQCVRLKTLPCEFGRLIMLQHIDLSFCRELSSLPQSFGMLTQLKTLDLSNCGNLIIQADIFEHIRSIEELKMENCRKLKMLPAQMTLQGSLRKLNLFGTSIEELPGDINELTRLQQLKIGSSFLKSLPPSLVNMPSLMELDLLNCTQLTSYSRSYGALHLLDSPQSQAEEANTVITSLYVYRRS